MRVASADYGVAFVEFPGFGLLAVGEVEVCRAREEN
jgi:hypothetical protein